jgi:hypothetical protein
MKRSYFKIAYFCLFIAALLGHAAFADSLRCGTRLVEVGDNKEEVFEKCGRPISTDSYCRDEYIRTKFGIEPICRRVELWTYNFGEGTFLENLEFEEGKVLNITHGNRVK